MHLHASNREIHYYKKRNKYNYPKIILKAKHLLSIKPM